MIRAIFLVITLLPLILIPSCIERNVSTTRVVKRQASHQSYTARRHPGPPPWIREAPPAMSPNAAYNRAWMPRSSQISRRWKRIVIHHSATAKGGALAFDKFHRGRGWDELGYHFVIGNGTDTADGFVEVGSRWHKQKHGAHCKTPDNFYNDHGIGICLVGDFTRSRPSPRQMAALNRLIRFLGQQCRISSAHLTTHAAVTGKTACPGRYFPLNSVRRALAQAEQTGEPATTPSTAIAGRLSAAPEAAAHAAPGDGPCCRAHMGL